jgi:hemerythrin-like metal-binding protein
VAERKWDAGLKTGVEAMDADHRRQVRSVKAIENAVRRGAEPVAIEAFLLGLIESTRAHFRAEHELMRRWGYPAHDSHAAAHDALLQELDDLKARHSAGSVEIDLATLQFLKRWLSEHIRGMDHALALYLEARRRPRKR